MCRFIESRRMTATFFGFVVAAVGCVDGVVVTG
jgi:hypothetical protein